MTVNWWCAPYHVTPGRWGWAFWRQHVTWCHLCCSEGSLCILHWSLCVYKEFRSVWLALEAVIMTPRASRSTIIENRLASLSTPRLVIVLMSFVLRIAIASIMLVAGVNWLGRTTSITVTRPNSAQWWLQSCVIMAHAGLCHWACSTFDGRVFMSSAECLAAAKELMLNAVALSLGHSILQGWLASPLQTTMKWSD